MVLYSIGWNLLARYYSKADIWRPRNLRRRFLLRSIPLSSIIAVRVFDVLYIAEELKYGNAALKKRLRKLMINNSVLKEADWVEPTH